MSLFSNNYTVASLVAIIGTGMTYTYFEYLLKPEDDTVVKPTMFDYGKRFIMFFIIGYAIGFMYKKFMSDGSNSVQTPTQDGGDVCGKDNGMFSKLKGVFGGLSKNDGEVVSNVSESVSESPKKAPWKEASNLKSQQNGGSVNPNGENFSTGRPSF
jgi:hypothetical protein